MLQPLPPPLLTLDVEDWEHANFAQLESRQGEISTLVRERRYRMEANTDRWIEILAATGARSTCFVLGEFARRYPDAIRRLAGAGHEIATHGDGHELVYRMERTQFREFLKRGLGALGELTGEAPQGFRAPSWSVDSRRTPWLCAELAMQGLRYDASVFPARTPLFGQGDAPASPVWEAGVLRIPAGVLKCGGLRVPFSSGAFFRLSPLALLRAGFRRAEQSGRSPMIVLHPRELDPAHPRLPLGGWEGWVHYVGLSTVIAKLQSLLRERNWTSIRDGYRGLLDSAGGRRGQSAEGHP